MQCAFQVPMKILDGTLRHGQKPYSARMRSYFCLLSCSCELAPLLDLQPWTGTGAQISRLGTNA